MGSFLLSPGRSGSAPASTNRTANWKVLLVVDEKRNQPVSVAIAAKAARAISADSGTAYKAKSCSSKIPADEVNKDNGMIKEGTRNEITTMDVIEALFKQRELLLENQSSILEEFLSNPTDQFDDYAWIEKEVQSEPLTNQDSRINIIKDLCQKIDTVIDERPLGKKRKMANDK